MFRKLIKPALLRLLIWTEKAPAERASIIPKVSFWNREIHIPALVIVSINAVLILLSLALEIGPSRVKLAGLLIFLAVLFYLFIGYIKRFVPEVVQDNDAAMLLGILVCASVFLMEIPRSLNMLSPYFVPIAGVVLLTALLLGTNAGIVMAVVLPLVAGVLYDFRLEYFIYHAAGAFAAVAVSGNINSRQDITAAGVRIALMNVLAILIFSTLEQVRIYRLQPVLGEVLWAASNGIFASILVLGLMPPLETFFSRITNVKLLELANMDRDLLKRLMLEAPGTYHHSLMVATVAEQAAEAIGANALLVRVGALYHDVGKLIKPDYFIENQIAMENPHDFLRPSMSGIVVISHVKEGVSMAKRNNLDSPIVRLIEEHHGTSLMYSIYQKALENVDEAPEGNYRYTGPKPSTKESAILMLADACEAASRTLASPSAGRIRDLVEKIINNKFIDGQLAHAPLQLLDLHKIAESMIMTLTSIYHARIEYEQSEKSEEIDKG
jgi:hypothetical protein